MCFCIFKVCPIYTGLAYPQLTYLYNPTFAVAAGKKKERETKPVKPKSSDEDWDGGTKRPRLSAKLARADF
jgi:hypothetical protein